MIAQEIEEMERKLPKQVSPNYSKIRNGAGNL